MVSFFECRANTNDALLEYIQLFGTNQVQIHYTTYNTKTNILQYANAASSTNWSNIHTSFNFPFQNQYHVLDSRTNKSRFYRLLTRE